MKTNMGYTDRLFRVVIAIVIGFLAYGNIVTGTLAVVFYIVAAVLLVTSLIGFCPLYMPFGLNTNKEGKTS